MIRFSLAAFLLSVFVTAAAVFSWWHHGRTELENRRNTNAKSAAIPAKEPVIPGVPLQLSFSDFYAGYVAAGYDFSLIDRLDTGELRALLDNAATAPWDRKVSFNAWTLLERWMELDPEAALAWTLALPPGEFRKTVGLNTLRSWAGENPADAVRWFTACTGHRPARFEEIDDGILLKEWGDIAEVVKGYDIRSVNEIVKDLRSLKKEDFVVRSHHTPHSRLTHEFRAAAGQPAQFRPVMEFLQSVAADARDPLAEWAENEKPFLLQQALPRNPLAVMRWLEEHPHSTWGDGLVDGAIGSLWCYCRENAGSDAADREPVERPSTAEVMDWFMRIPRMSREVSSIESFVHSWPDADQAAEILNRQPPGLDTDKARAIMALRLVDDDPVAAVPWMEAITDDSVRGKTEEELFRKWRQLDPVGAAAWIADHPAE